MASRKRKLSESFGSFTDLKPDEITILKIGAEELVAAYRNKNELRWKEIIHDANRKIGKHNRGILVGFALSLIEGGKI